MVGKGGIGREEMVGKRKVVGMRRGKE